jgi:hypothetical protein
MASVGVVRTTRRFLGLNHRFSFLNPGSTLLRTNSIEFPFRWRDFQNTVFAEHGENDYENLSSVSPSSKIRNSFCRGAMNISGGKSSSSNHEPSSVAICFKIRDFWGSSWRTWSYPIFKKMAIISRDVTLETPQSGFPECVWRIA